MEIETIIKKARERQKQLEPKVEIPTQTIPPAPKPELPPLWAHQEEAIRRARGLDYFALFFEVGTGKTRTIIEILEEKFNNHGKTLKTLVLCPLIVVENFKREIELFGDKAKGNVITLTGPNKKRLSTFLENKDSPTPRIFITNYECLYNEDMVLEFRRWKPTVTIYDELHKLKDSSAKRTKVATDIADLAQYRFGLSGTPILNTQLDIFSQIRLLDSGHSFGKNFYAFRMIYFYDANAGRKGTHSYFPNWLPKPGIDKDLKDKIKTFTMSVKKEECLDLPPLLKKQVTCNMGPDQARAYGQMKKDFIAFIKDQACVAELAITKALRLQQIVSGYATTEDENDITFNDTPRLQVLEQLVTDIVPTAKVIIWATFRKNYQMISKMLEGLNVTFATLTGDTQDKQAEVDRFQLDDSVRVMIANPGAGGIGINLTKASYMIYYSRSFNLEHEIQSEARCYRGGSEQHSKVTRIDIITPNTIDDIISKVLEEKKKIGDNVLSNQDIMEILKRDLTSSAKKPGPKPL